MYHIYSKLKEYSLCGKRFHVPGHKGDKEFCELFPDAIIDVTELSYSDNLFDPKGIIAAAQSDLAEIVGAKKSYILTGGSSSGVLSMIRAAAKKGSKIIVPRNSHASVWNACELFGLQPVIVQGEEKNGLVSAPSPEIIERLMESDSSISCMVATSPDYFGFFAPLKEYAEIMKKRGGYLLVDGAHGAHLALEKGRVGHAGLYADIWVDGAHKSLPTLTQGALVSTNRDELVAPLEKALAIFRTTSPSYPIMASVEYGFKYYKKNEKAIILAKAAVTNFRESFKRLVLPSDDWTKIVVDFSKAGISADKAAQALEKEGIFFELQAGSFVLFYASPCTTESDMSELSNVLEKILGDDSLKGGNERLSLPKTGGDCAFDFAVNAPRELIAIGDAEGRTCAANAGATPPCIAVVAAGEIVTRGAIETLLAAKNTFGVTDGKIWVVKK